MASPAVDPVAEALRARTLWITTARTVHQRRAGRELTVRDGAGAALLTARASDWSRDITVRGSDRSGDVVLVIRRRRLFPFTGKVDLIDAARNRRLGLLHRNGRVRDANGTVVGRFVDARSLQRQTAESLLEGLGAAIVGGDATGATLNTDAYVYLAGTGDAGGLVRAKLPFAVPDAARTTSPLPGLSRFVPRRWRERMAERMRPRGWRLERTMLPPAEDPRLSIAAAILTVELNRW